MRNVQCFHRLIGPDIRGPISARHCQLVVCAVFNDTPRTAVCRKNHVFHFYPPSFGAILIKHLCPVSVNLLQLEPLLPKQHRKSFSLCFPHKWIPQVAFIGQILFIYLSLNDEGPAGGKNATWRGTRVGMADLFRCSCSARCWAFCCTPVRACWSRWYKPESTQIETLRPGNMGDLEAGKRRCFSPRSDWDAEAQNHLCPNCNGNTAYVSVKTCLCWVLKMDGWMSCWLKSLISRQMQWENTHTKNPPTLQAVCPLAHKMYFLKWEIFLSMLKNPMACGVNCSLTCFLGAEWGNKNLQMATKFASFISMNVRQ